MRFQSEEKPFQVKPNLLLGLLVTILKLVFLAAFAAVGLYYIPRFFGADYSILVTIYSQFISIETLKMISLYVAGFIAILVMVFKTLELSGVKMIFLNEGFEYHHGLIIMQKKDIFYSNVLRINYQNGILFGNIIIELTGTDVMTIRVPYVRYPGAMTAKIKKKIDDSVSSSLYDRMKSADKTIEEETAENLIGVVRSERITKENLATNIEKALDGEKVSKNVFEILLAQLLKSGKITKGDLAGVMFSMHDKGLMSKKDIADVLFYLNNI